MAKFYKLRVLDINQNTDDCVIVTLGVPEDIKGLFSYKQGQYLTLRSIINEETVQRSYSLCSSPIEESWRVGIKQVPEGKFSTYANKILKIGDTLESLPPAGNFYIELDKGTPKNYVCFAAGSGITPMLSIIKTHLISEPQSTFKLFYINQTVSSIILKEELESLKNRFMSRFEIFHFLTKQNRNIELFNGRIDKEKLAIIFDSICDTKQIDDYFLCGPEAMIFLVKDFLVEQAVDESKIHFELFTSSGEKPKLSQAVQAELSGKVCEVTLI